MTGIEAVWISDSDLEIGAEVEGFDFSVRGRGSGHYHTNEHFRSRALERGEQPLSRGSRVRG